MKIYLLIDQKAKIKVCWFSLRAVKKKLFRASLTVSGGLVAIFGVPWHLSHHLSLAFIFTWFSRVHVCL